MTQTIDPEFAQKLRTDLGDGLGVVVELRIKVHTNGAMSVEAPIGDKALCLQLLDHARDAINRNASPKALIVPGEDTDL